MLLTKLELFAAINANIQLLDGERYLDPNQEGMHITMDNYVAEYKESIDRLSLLIDAYNSI